MKRHIFLSFATACAAVLAGMPGWPAGAAGQQAPQVLIPPENPETDPPLPVGTADDIAARMAARRAQQIQLQNASTPAGGFAIPAGRSGPTGAGTFGPPAAPAAIALPEPTTPIAPDSNLTMNYENAPVDTILKDIARAYGIIIVTNVNLPQRVTIRVPTPINANEAVELLNAALLTQGYGTLATKSDATLQAKTILRIATVTELKKAQIPVYQGANPDVIPLNDLLITQIIPVKNLAAVSLRNDLAPLLSADADVTANSGSNCIVVTDTAAKIHRLVEIIAAIDKVAADRPPLPAGTITSGRGSVARPSDIPYVMSMAVDGGVIQIRHGDILGEVFGPRVDIVAPVAGMLAKVHVHDGQKVKAGDLLFEFDASAAEAELQIAQTRLATARAKLPMTAPAAGSFEMDAAKAEISIAEALVALDRHNLQSLQLRAPIDGVLTTVDAVPGQFVPLSNPPLTQIVGTDDFKITFKLAFNDRTRLKVGQKITFTVGDKLQPFPAEITFISPTADSSNRTEIRARLTGEVEPLVPGVLGTVTLPEL